MQRQLVWATLTEGEDESGREIPGEWHEYRVAIEPQKRGKRVFVWVCVCEGVCCCQWWTALIAHTELVCLSETDGETEKERETIKALLIERQINQKKRDWLAWGRRREKRQRRTHSELSFHFHLFNKPNISELELRVLLTFLLEVGLSVSGDNCFAEIKSALVCVFVYWSYFCLSVIYKPILNGESYIL